MRIRFWGTRGSLATPGPTTLRYGGNTSCVEARANDGTLIVLDCGTGAHRLGQALMAEAKQPVRGHLMITHTHWDHIQGFPFFAPVFTAGSEWDLYAPSGLGERLEAVLSAQMQHPYFPVTLSQLSATIRYHDLVEGVLTVGGVRVVAQYLNHPALTLGYRLEADGASVVYAVDHEPHMRDRPEGGGMGSPGEASPHAEDTRHVAFLEGADLVIHDAQYTAEEYPEKVNWGHSPAETAVDYALAAHVRRLALTHHDPLRDDDAVDRLVEVCRERVRRAAGTLDVFAAAEGQIIELTRRETRAPRPRRRAAASTASQSSPAHVVLIADDDPVILELLKATLSSDAFRLYTASDGETALNIARSVRPSLILLDWLMPGLDGTDVTRALRAERDPYFRDVPIVLITAEAGAAKTQEGFAAGVTDYLTKPFKAPFVRARVRAWLERVGGDADRGP
jgi:CheY-like chemotaxis protein/phosphoribosyl 1,2-cyclic phosphodiesterase